MCDIEMTPEDSILDYQVHSGSATGLFLTEFYRCRTYMVPTIARFGAL
jgi:hypothetical protein